MAPLPTVLRLVEALDGMLGMIVHEGRHARAVDGAHASTGEAILVVDGHVSAESTSLADRLAIECEVAFRKIVGPKASAERQDGTAAVAVCLDHLPELLYERRVGDLRIVPEPKRYGAPRHGGLSKLLCLEQRRLFAP